MNYCKVCGKKLELTPEYDMCMECQGKQHRTFTLPSNDTIASNKTDEIRGVSMTADQVFKLVEKNTSEIGNFNITFNEHITSSTYDCLNNKTYPTTAKDYYGLDDEDIETNSDVDWEKNIYCFTWHNTTQVGFYMIYSNTFDGLIKKIEKLLEELK